MIISKMMMMMRRCGVAGLVSHGDVDGGMSNQWRLRKAAQRQLTRKATFHDERRQRGRWGSVVCKGWKELCARGGKRCV